jgi:hypothetical protein
MTVTFYLPFKIDFFFFFAVSDFLTDPFVYAYSRRKGRNFPRSLFSFLFLSHHMPFFNPSQSESDYILVGAARDHTKTCDKFHIIS